jgi:hypothetical protein
MVKQHRMAAIYHSRRCIQIFVEKSDLLLGLANVQFFGRYNCDLSDPMIVYRDRSAVTE